MNAGTPLAQDHVTLYESPDPERVFSYSPGICRLSAGRLVATGGPRLIATIDLGGPGVDNLSGAKWHRGENNRAWQGKVFTSDDHGGRWTHRADFPFMHARPFVAGDKVYVLGQAGDLSIIASADGGETWSQTHRLTEGERWHQAPCNVLHANGCVYLVMERRTRQECKGWNISENAPVLMRAPVDADLTRRESWTFATELAFCDNVFDRELDWFGVPFYDVRYPEGKMVGPGRHCAPCGWLETNVVQFADPEHLWHDPEGKTFHLWMRAHTGGTGYACILKVVEEAPGAGAMTTTFETVPSGQKVVYVPCPGGQMKFHVLYDEPTKLYWLLSTQATDSMTRPDRLPPERYNLPNNERRRLQLHFSKNMVDWCFAGIVAMGEADNASRHYASMVVDGDDLLVLSRSGDDQAKTAHDGNLITFHTVKEFRHLVY